MISEVVERKKEREREKEGRYDMICVSDFVVVVERGVDEEYS